MTEPALLDAITVEPTAQPAQASIIWMHGLGADGHDFESIVHRLNIEQLSLRFIFPHAPVRSITMNQGHAARAWYDIYTISDLAKEDSKSIEESRLSIMQLIQHEHDLGIPYHKICLAGFSQGGAMALYTGLTYPNQLAGVVALSCYLPLAQQFIDQAHRANKHTPIFQAHGDLDPMISIRVGKASHDFLQKLNYSISWHHYPMQHAVCDTEVRDLSQWLQKIYS